MSKTAIVLLLAAFAAACGAAPVGENRNNSAHANTANATSAQSSNSGTISSNSPASRPLSGERVTTPVEEKFDGNATPAGWKWIDPEAGNGSAEMSLSGGSLKFNVLSNRDFFGENRTAPRLLKAIEGDFEIETRVKFDPRRDYQGAGIVIYADAQNYLRLERSFGGLGGGTSGIRLDVDAKDDYRAITTPDSVPTEAGTVDLKVLRNGKRFIAFWRLDEEGEWKEVGEFVSEFPETVEAGLIACNTSKPIPVEFLYIKLSPAK